MKRFIILFVFLLSSPAAFNRTETDSLLDALKKSEEAEKIKIMCRLTFNYYITGDTAKFIKYGNSAIALAGQIKRFDLQVDALNTLAYSYSYYNKVQADTLTRRALRIANNIKYEKGTGEALFNLGYNNRSNFQTAYNFYTQAGEIARKYNLSLLQADIITGIGDIYFSIGNYKEALKYYLQSHKIFDSLSRENKSTMVLYHYGNLLNSIGINYKKTGNYDKALNYYMEYSRISLLAGDSLGHAIAYNNMGIIYANLKNYKQSFGYYNYSLNLFRAINNYDFLPDIYMNMGNLFTDIKRYDSALFYLNKAKSMFYANDNGSKVLFCMCNIANIYYSKKDFQKSLTIFRKILSNSLNAGDDELRLQIYQGLYNTYEALGNYQKSYKYFKLHSKLNDSLAEINKADEIGRLSEQFRIEKQLDDKKRFEEERRKINSARLERRNNLEYSGIFIFILLIYLFFIFVGKYRFKPVFADAMIFVVIILLFEFIQLFIDPWKNKLANNEPLFLLSFNIILAIVFSPLRTILSNFLEKKKLFYK